MPISPSAPGIDAAVAHPAGRSGLRLDYHAADRGPVFRRVLQAAATGEPASAPATHEGADALSRLRRDLLSGAATLVESPTAAAQVPAGPPAAGPAPRVAWHHDDIKGRRLGDHPAAGTGGDMETWLFGEDGFGFDDLVDVINPLQHIPIVSSIYRWITGDEISPAATVAGGVLFGGPIGLAGSVASVALEEATGRDLGGHALAMVFGDDAPAGEGTLQPPAAAGLAAAPGGAPAPPPARPIPAQLATAEPGAAPVLFIPAATPGADASEAAAPVAAAPELPTAADMAIAAQMKRALDKYEALMRGRAAPPPGGSGRFTAGGLHDGRF